jgi:hypothetical protein
MDNNLSYYQRNKERLKQYQIQYYKDNYKKIREYQTEYWKHYQKRRAPQFKKPLITITKENNIIISNNNIIVSFNDFKSAI